MPDYLGADQRKEKEKREDDQQIQGNLKVNGVL
jgi:hypothetical protein